MGRKASKRPLEDTTHDTDDVVAKKPRINGDVLRLSKLYKDLSAESDDVRLEAAKQILIKFSPENAPSSDAVETALSRLTLGLCSHEKAARNGFFITLTELLRQLYVQPEGPIDGFDISVDGIVKMIEEKTKVQGNVPGQEKRDYIMGKLLGFKALMQSRALFEPHMSSDCWNTVLDHIFHIAKDQQWLREECALVLTDVAKSLESQPHAGECVKTLIQRLVSSKMTNTPEGVAIWLTARAQFVSVLPDGVWHKHDPLHKKERTRLANILKESFHDADGKDANGGTPIAKWGTSLINPKFAWNIVLSEMLRRDGTTQHPTSNSEKLGFPQLWLDIVDNNLFALSASHERRLWGFKLFSTLIATAPAWSLRSLFSPNLMRSWRNQTKKDDRFLHSAAQSALRAIPLRVQQEPASGLPIIEALTTKHGRDDNDRFTHQKTLEQILVATDDNTLKSIVRYLHWFLIHPDVKEQVAADNLRRVIADILLSAIREYKHYGDSNSLADPERDSWLHDILEIFVDHAYFVPSEHAKKKKLPSPPITESTQETFQVRLASCLARLLEVDTGSRTSFPCLIITLLRAKDASKMHKSVLQADQTVSETLAKSFKTLDALVAKSSKSSAKADAEGFTLLYALAILQVFNGDGDAVLLLEDLDASRKSLSKAKKGKGSHGADASEAFVEILLTFLGNPRALFGKIAKEAFKIVAADVTSSGITALTDILDVAETAEGQRQLFEQAGEEGSLASNSDADDVEEFSDVEMVDDHSDGIGGSDSDVDSAEDTSSDDDDSEDESEGDDDEDDEELTSFNKLLADTLKTSKATLDGEDSEDSSDDEDMDDEQMMALDPHLTKIFQERSKQSETTGKKQREEAKQNVKQFKSRVLDLLAIFMEKECSSPLTLDVVLPVLRRIRAGGDKALSEKSYKLIKTYTDSRANHKAPLPKPDNVEHTWEILREIHEEANLGGGSTLHTTACSLASLHLVKILVQLDKTNYGEVANIYAETQKKWFADKKSGIQPLLFTQFQNWSASARK